MHRFSNILTALIVTFLIGVAAGWLRYWIGFIVIFQNALWAWVIGLCFHAIRPVPVDADREWQEANTFAWHWSLLLILIFQAAQLLGLGLAQPWFESFEYFKAVLAGESSEMLLGIGFVSGGLWIICMLIDAAVMLVVLTVCLGENTPDSEDILEDNTEEADG